MRSAYEEFAAGEANKNLGTDAIPYHARENSLPFSYGQINKASTPLRPTAARSRNNGVGRDFDFDFDFDFGLDLGDTGDRGDRGDRGGVGGGGGGGVAGGARANEKDINLNVTPSDRDRDRDREREGDLRYIYRSDSHFGSSATASDRYKTTTSSMDETDANTIKAQPRLTSPLLVRKTLSDASGRSPTRSTTNTIANTYHYSYGSLSRTGAGAGAGAGDNFDRFGVNGNINDNNNYYSETPRKTAVRDDFEELLRERREKVFHEYRATTHGAPQQPQQPQPLPPPRRFVNGSVPGQQPPQIPSRSHSQTGKYNYDFEFNLNLSDELPRRSNTIDRTSASTSTLQPQRYQTRDIPLTSTYVERNYHTISSSSPSYATSRDNKSGRDNANLTSMFDIYARPFDERKPSGRPPMESAPRTAATAAMAATASTATTTTIATERPPATTASTLRTRQADYATFRNENVYGRQQAYVGQMADTKPTSPIYATATRKVSSTYRSAATASLPPPRARAASFTVTDYPSPSPVRRPETPAFPVTPRTPYAAVVVGSNYAATPPYKTNGHQQQLQHQQHQQHQQQQQQPQQQQQSVTEVQHYSVEPIYGTSYRPRLNSSLSLANSEPQEVAAHLVKFAKDSSKFWYKPTLSREEAISLLLNVAPGTFIVRDSTTYRNAYGLVVRVAQPPPGAAATGKPDELVRHFLIEPTTRGVRLKGCPNEPVFTSLSALVYEHSINQLALPCVLRIPERDLLPPLMEPTPAQKQLLTQGAACNVLWLYSCETESLTGEEAIRKAIRLMYALPCLPTPTEVHFKVSQQGITLTDNTRKKFFRKHYAADMISYCAIDPDHRMWTMQPEGEGAAPPTVGALKKTIFAFVARRSASSKDNQCHVFCDLAITQPASAIVSFANKTLPTEKQHNYVL